MNKIKNWFFAAVSILLINNAYSQKSNYIATDSTMISGVKLIRGTAKENAQFIRTNGKNKAIKFYPDQIKEYGFKSGEKYKAINISVAGQSKKVFLEEVVQGKITLYYYQEKGVKTYFLGKEGMGLIELTKDNDFRKKISEKTNDFEWKMNQVELVKYNRASLVKLLSMYNNEYNKPMPYLRLGLIIGYNMTSLVSTSDLQVGSENAIIFPLSSAVTLGLFADFPIGSSNFSLNSGVNFSKSGFSSHTSNTQVDIDVVINMTSINFPLLLRYTLPTLAWRPFVNAGGIYSYHLKNESKVYRSTNDQNVISISERSQKQLISDAMLGYSFGIGVQRNLTKKKVASGELRINNLLGKDETSNKNQLELLMSFSF